MLLTTTQENQKLQKDKTTIVRSIQNENENLREKYMELLENKTELEKYLKFMQSKIPKKVLQEATEQYFSTLPEAEENDASENDDF